MPASSSTERKTSNCKWITYKLLLIVMQICFDKKTHMPVAGHNPAIWVSEREGAFYIMDRWKLVRIGRDSNFVPQIISEKPDEDEAYKTMGFYDRRIPDTLYDEIRNKGICGFFLLSKKEYDQIDDSVGSHSALALANGQGLVNQDLPVRVRSGAVLTFGCRSFTISRWTPNSVKYLHMVKTSGKRIVQVHAYPNLDMIVYGNGDGDLYSHYFCVNDGGSGKVTRIDKLPISPTQISFTSNKDMIVCGNGLIKVYSTDKEHFVPKMFTEIAARSFEILGNYLVVNKGHEGIEVLDMSKKLASVLTARMPFPIDRMLCDCIRGQILITSNRGTDLAIMHLDSFV